MRHRRHNHHDSFGPFGQVLEDLFNKSIGDIVGGDLCQNTPAANTFETDDAYHLEIAAPGVAKADIKLRIEGSHLIISADIDSEEHPEFKRREFNYHKFSRRFKMKDDIDTKKIKASYDLGVLKVQLPKLDAKAYEKKTSIKID